MPALPSGTVTFLFTDIEDSTALWERDRSAMAAAVDRHLVLLRTAIERHQGVLFKIVGDAVQAAFPTAPDAVAASVEAQRTLLVEPWSEATGPLRVRVALHTTAAAPRDGDYLAPGLNRLARLVAAGHGGQVLISLATQELARDALPADVSLRDLGEHPLRDLYRPERVFQLLHPDLPADFPSIRTLATRPNNLPLQPTPFLGREGQIEQGVDLLRRDDVRLVTITGPGGVGKTRLALQVAADLLERFPDGVWFVDLSALEDPAQVLPAIGAVLGVRDGAVTTARLSAVVESKRLLLVLDNFERLLEAAPIAAALLAGAPNVKVLATSRIPLHAYGEQEYPLPPLPLPDPAHLPPIEHLSQYEAVRLFVARAQAVTPDFTLTTANAPAVAEICHRLDGLPLAIELAAARVKVLPPQALLKRLEQRLPLLTGGARTAPARQQTMRDTIAWSHDLLSPDEQTVFRRLAVFPGGCTIDAAEAVAGGGETIDVFTGMAALVDESLLRQEEGLEGEPRFRMLETVREYGLEQLEERGEGDATRDCLAAWALALAEQAEPTQLVDTMSPTWVARLDAELPNLRAAVTLLLARGEATRALRLLVAAEDFWTQRHISNPELHRWLETALTAAPDAPVGDQAIAHWLLSIVNANLGHEEAALHHAKRSLATAKELGEPLSLGNAHVALAVTWENRGDLSQAAAAYTEALASFHEAGAGARANEINVQSELGDKLILQGDLEAGVPLVEDALARLREIPDPPWFTVFVILVSGYTALQRRDLPRAARLFAEALDSVRELHHPQGLLSSIAGLAGVALARGQAERAARLLGAYEAARDRLGMRHMHLSLHAERITADVRTGLEPTAFEQAWAAGCTVLLEEAVTEALTIADEAITGTDR